MRVERDSMGEFEVPAGALYGPQTARAMANFPISGGGIGREMIEALGWIKRVAARVNRALGRLDAVRAGAIEEASREVAEGRHDRHFPVDVFQTGSGTSSNMNANEVIANRAGAILGGHEAALTVHPNDHVNLGQSSNDVFPSAMHLAAGVLLVRELLPALEGLRRTLSEKATAFDDIVKVGRTHLQDAVPIRLGQEFSGYAAQIAQGIRHVEAAREHLHELALGGAAVGTGLDTHPEFGRRMAAGLTDLVGVSFVEAGNHFEAQAAQDAVVHLSGALKGVAVSCIKIANDIRWLGSGPRLGLGELRAPAVQPGSSIMPGKVNPVIAESLIMVCAQVIGNDAAIALGGLYGNFELNTMLPLMARNVIEQIRLLSNGVQVFARKLVAGLEADRVRIAAGVERSLMIATALAPHVGHEAAAQIVAEADRTGRTVHEVARERGVLPPDILDRVLDLRRLTEPGLGPVSSADGKAAPDEAPKRS